MYLKSVTLKGFKSFPERTRLEFGPGTSVIVGPNGSGKSNVTDAVLWALGEQSPAAIRGHSMQDVIFGGAPGRQAAAAATVELVLDDSDGILGLGPEVSILRHLERSGEGEYRINGARCRLVDVLEVLSDTGLGKEMHSVVSQGRVEAIVTSRPRDRRLLIEEAAGLGKHRKRRRRAQLKLEHTQDNLDRALDIEREARSRLKPLKRQAEAAELHARLHRQMLEVRWELARDECRDRREGLERASANAEQLRARRRQIEGEIELAARGRREAEEALAARSTRREELSRRSFAAQAAADKLSYRADAISTALRLVADRSRRARAELDQRQQQASQDRPDDGARERVAALEAELAALERDREAELARQLAVLEQQLAEAGAAQARQAEAVTAAKALRDQAEAAVGQARAELREAERTVEAARRESARVGGELAAVNQFLRAHQSAPGGARSLADDLTVEPGFELAVAAALDGRLGAALAEDRAQAQELLERAGRDGGRVLIIGAGRRRDRGAPPLPGSVPLAEHVHGTGAEALLARALLHDAWLVDRLDAVAADFAGVAVTRGGRVYVGSTGELRQAPKIGEDRVLAERNRREQLVAASEAAASAEQAARAHVQALTQRLAELDVSRERAVAGHRGAVEACDEAAEQQARLAATVRRRRMAPDDGPGAGQRAQLRAQLAAERTQLERAARERAGRLRDIQRLQAEIERDARLAPAIESLLAELAGVAEAIAERKRSFDAELARDRQAGEALAAQLRACAQEEAAIQARLHAASEEMTEAEVRAQRARDQEQEAASTLRALAAELDLEPEPAAAPLAGARRQELDTRLERLRRSREQLGPVNPLAQDEYAQALAHVEELEAQRNDLETALRELAKLIRDTDRQIRETFEQTFQAAARNFEELAARVFPGGSGRLRLIGEADARAPLVGDSGSGPGEPDDLEGAGGEDDESLGVEIEVTPVGKTMKRLTLLSGGEKSMTALAFLFAVFLARPCPFYIMDEVEAALDDLNISRFLELLDSYSDRAQFIVVTHQKRTMEAADALYGVSMGAEGVSKVVSRRLPARQLVS
jgi:chromosome segregation protein